MKNKKNPRRFHHLKTADRDEIEILLCRGYSQTEIAQALRVDKSTISREIAGRQRKNGYYDARTAKQKAYAKRLHSKYQGMKVEAVPELREQIVVMLRAHRSPDEIAGRLDKEKSTQRIGKDAIYRWLYSAWGNKYARYLCTRRRRHRKQRRVAWREMIPGRIPLSMRPMVGIHGEADIFVSPRRAETSASVALVCEKESKYICGTKMPNRKPGTMASAMQKMVSEISVDDLTLDNGIENKNHKDFGVSAYFCNPHSPWQKPLIEQSIGLMRRWFIPKGTDLRTVKEETLQEYIAILNSKYRKSLGWRSAYEVAVEHGILKTKIPAEAREQRVERVAFQVRI